jgi:hypothetical protein
MNRHFFGDIGLAVLLALPTVALARPEAPKDAAPAVSPIVEKAALAESTHAERRISLNS